MTHRLTLCALYKTRFHTSSRDSSHMEGSLLTITKVTKDFSPLRHGPMNSGATTFWINNYPTRVQLIEGFCCHFSFYQRAVFDQHFLPSSRLYIVRYLVLPSTQFTGRETCAIILPDLLQAKQRTWDQVEIFMSVFVALISKKIGDLCEVSMFLVLVYKANGVHWYLRISSNRLSVKQFVAPLEPSWICDGFRRVDLTNSA